VYARAGRWLMLTNIHLLMKEEVPSWFAILPKNINTL